MRCSERFQASCHSVAIVTYFCKGVWLSFDAFFLFWLPRLFRSHCESSMQMAVVAK